MISKLVEMRLVEPTAARKVLSIPIESDCNIVRLQYAETSPNNRD